MPITTILYDLGKTLLLFDFTRINDALANSSGLSQDDVKERVREPYNAFCRGEIDAHGWHRFIEETFELSMPFEEFPRFWADIFWLNEPIVALARRLRPHYRSYLASNTEEIHLAWCVEKFPIGEIVDGMVLSYEIGVMKPERAFFEGGLAKFGLAPEECVFIDDLPENVDGARACGLHGVVCAAGEQVERDLAALGVTA